MCTWTNVHNLPSRVIRVLNGHYKEHKPDLGRLSITDLIEEPLIRLLYIRFYDILVRDYSDLLTMVQGTALHDRYESCASDDEDAEHKFEDAVSDIIVVGKADSYFDTTVMDVKQTGCYGEKYRADKWEKQLNCYAWQRRKRGQEVTKLIIDIWYRDWKLSNTGWKDYPPIPFRELELPLWTFEEQDKYIRSQVQIHLHMPVFDRPEDYGFSCSDEQRGIRFEAYKGKNKTCSKAGETRQEVENYINAQDNPEIFRIEQSEPIFCKLYCKSKSVCPFAKEV